MSKSINPKVTIKCNNHHTLIEIKSKLKFIDAESMVIVCKKCTNQVSIDFKNNKLQISEIEKDQGVNNVR